MKNQSLIILPFDSEQFKSIIKGSVRDIFEDTVTRAVAAVFSQGASVNDWQPCPICEGLGVVPSDGFTTMNVTKECPICVGKRIISRQTGNPPE